MTTTAAAILAAQLPAAAELLTLPNDGNRQEPAQGELITMPTPGFRHTVDELIDLDYAFHHANRLYLEADRRRNPMRS